MYKGMYKATKLFVESTKAYIDSIYEITKNGFTGALTSGHPTSMMKVTSELVKRGVLVKTHLGGNRYHWQWGAGSAPTNHFYNSVAYAIGSHQAILSSNANKARMAGQELAPKPLKAISVTSTMSSPTLKNATLQELWDELKSRGCVIENNHLVVIERKVIA